MPVGGTPDFSRMYFTYAGTLLPQDASRAPHSGTGELVESWGFYEYTDGSLREADVLPDGSLDPFGAVPAASGHGRSRAGNEVSEDGERAFFVSPDPQSCKENGGQNDCATDPPELYVRENGERSVLVSRDMLLSEDDGLPVGAPGGVLAMANPSLQLHLRGTQADGAEVFASSDGSQAFFQTDDALTQAAEEASPGSEPKTYQFDVSTGVLTYLPGVEGEIVAASKQGTAMAFVRPEAGGEPAQLDYWAIGPNGGSVTPVAALPEAGGAVPEARISNEGAVLVFQTAERLSGAFNSGGFEEIYRYYAPSNTLGCVSCPPAGVAPREGASMSTLHWIEENASGSTNGVEKTLGPSVDQRGISGNGERIFFESSDPLTPTVANTDSPEQPVLEDILAPQGRNVFEWEDGTVYLISTGTSPRNTWLLGSSESGDDVFIATTQGLVPGDTDGGYDVYDARIPRPGDSPSPSPASCEDASCEGAASAPAPGATPSSASFSGSENIAPEGPPVPAGVAKPAPAKPVKCKKGFVRKKAKCVRTKAKAGKDKKASVGSASKGGRAGR